MSSEVFYEDGLEFECTRCSNCCRHDPGYVFLSTKDLERLAEGKGVSVQEFRDAYCRSVNIGPVGRLSLNEKPNYDCIFWEEQGCTVYDHRPVQCRTYPFWSSNLLSRESWDREAFHCPGINRGRRYSRREIDKFIRMREIEDLLT